MTKLKINFTGTNVEYEGDENFLKTDVPNLLDAVKKSHNEEVKKQLLDINEDLERISIEMDQYSKNISKHNEESKEMVNDFCEKLSNFLMSIEKLSINKKELLHAKEQISEELIHFKLNYSTLWDTMQKDNRQYTLLGNIWKTKHDANTSAINNIR